MIKLGIIVITSSTLALSSALMQDSQDTSNSGLNAQDHSVELVQPHDKTLQLHIDDKSPATSNSLKDPLKRNRSLVTRPITRELIEDCLEVAHEVDPQLAMWLERLKANNSRQEFEHAIQRNARYLLGLVELRERNPVIYDLKMREIKTGSEIKQVTKLLQEAVDTDSKDQAEMLEMRLLELVRMQASYSIESRGRILLRIQEHAADLEQKIDEEASSFEQTVEQQLQKILDKINSKSTAQPQNPSTSG